MDYEFHIYFPRTNVHEHKKMWGRTRQEAYQALLELQRQHTGGLSAFEIVTDEPVQTRQVPARAGHTD